MSDVAPDALVALLLDDAGRLGASASAAFRAGDDDRAEALVARLRTIMRTLDAALDRDAGPIGGHLGAIYDYLLRRLGRGRTDAEAVDEAVADLAVLCEAWVALVAHGTSAG